MKDLSRIVVFLGVILPWAVPLRAQGPSPSAKSTEKSEPSADKTPLLDINTVTEKELKELPGMDELYAKKIVEGRPDVRKDDLVNKTIIPLAT